MTFVSMFAMLILFGVSLQATLLGMRDPRLTRRLHSYVWAAGAFALGSVALAGFFYFYEGESHIPLLARTGHTLMIVALAIAFVSAILWVYFLIRRHYSVEEGDIPRHHAPLTSRIKFLYRLSQPDWEELDLTKYSQEDRRDASNITRIVEVTSTLVAFPGILILLAASIMMNIRGSEASDFAARTLGYYTLLIATCWTIVYLVTLAVVSINQVLRDQGSGLSPAAVAVSVGTWAGFGAAGGVFVGALIPIVVIALPNSPFKGLDVTLLDTISPDLLLNISTAGAVIGFLLGEAISVTALARGEKNLITQTVVPPLVFGATASVLGAFRLRPGAISRYLASQYKEDYLKGDALTASPFETASKADLDTSEGWASLVASFDKSGWNSFVDTHLYFWITWAVVLLVIMFSFTIRAHQRELALANMESRGKKKQGKKDSTKTKNSTKKKRQKNEPSQEPLGAGSTTDYESASKDKRKPQ